MKLIMKNIIGSFALILVVFTGFGQDLHFSQFQMTPLQMDASMTGKQGDYRIILNYRDQWRSIANPYKTIGFSMETAFNKKRSKSNFFGAGLSLYQDRAGDINMALLEVDLSLAYHIKVDQGKYLSAGLQGGFGQRSVDESTMRFDNQYDGEGHNSSYSSNENMSSTSFFYPDFSLGVSYSANVGVSSIKVSSNNGYDGKKVNIGMAMHHLPKFKNSFLDNPDQKLDFRYVLHGWSSFGIKNMKLAIQPSGFIALQNGAYEVTLGAYYRYTLKEQSKFTGLVKGSAISLGTHYRTGDALILAGLLEMGSFAVGASYDFNVSGLTKVSHGRGGFEISLRYMNPNPFGAFMKSSPKFQ